MGSYTTKWGHTQPKVFTHVQKGSHAARQSHTHGQKGLHAARQGHTHGQKGSHAARQGHMGQAREGIRLVASGGFLTEMLQLTE